MLVEEHKGKGDNFLLGSVRLNFAMWCEKGCLQLYEKETPTQAFSCEICEIFKNICERPLALNLAQNINVRQLSYHKGKKGIDKIY